MLPLRQYFSRRLTTLQTVLVIVVLITLAGLGYWAYQFATAKLLEAQVNAVLPRVCVEIREERAKLVSAIEAYKAHFGSYPPDHIINRNPVIVEPVTNSLFYELVGVIYNPTNKMVQAGGLEPAEAKYVKEFLQCDGFKNYAESADKVIRFLQIDPLPARQFHDDPDVFALGFEISYEAVPPELAWEFDTTSWRYVSSAPTNNPGKFDLWIELSTKKQKRVIGNWKAVE